MVSVRSSRLLKLCNALFVVLLALLISGAGAIAQTWELGSKRFSTNAATAAPPLRIQSAGRAALGTFRFVGRVGGVSFEAIAEPESSLAGQPNELRYDPSQPDGSRVTVRIGLQTVRAQIADWQLQPTVAFANSEYNAVVSLFGEGSDQTKFYYIQYNDAFKDTLMGMRMLQADILFISLGEHWRLPRYNGQVLLGTGETSPQQAQSQNAAAQLQSALEGRKWRSWVLTDADTRPTFGLSNGMLRISAQPYYYFWNLDEADMNVKNTARRALIAEYNSILDANQKKIDQYNALVPTYNSATAARRNELKSQLDRLKAEIDRAESSLTAMKQRLESSEFEPRVFEVTQLTSAMRGLDQTISKYNPPIYASYQRLAQFAAFFRHVKQRYPNNWATFRQAVANISISPAVKTPTTWEKAQR